VITPADPTRTCTPGARCTKEAGRRQSIQHGNIGKKNLRIWLTVRRLKVVRTDWPGGNGGGSQKGEKSSANRNCKKSGRKGEGWREGCPKGVFIGLRTLKCATPSI